MPYTPEQTIAALWQALKPAPAQDEDERGYTAAIDRARTILGEYGLEGTDEELLAGVEPALRRWLTDADDSDTADYTAPYAASYRTGQAAIRDILDGVDDEVLAHLEDAHRAYTRLYTAAKEA